MGMALYKGAAQSQKGSTYPLISFLFKFGPTFS